MVLSAMPKKPTTHIQNTAPGPPRLMAMATPPMLPRPTVADSAADRAWKWLMAPGSPAEPAPLVPVEPLDPEEP